MRKTALLLALAAFFTGCGDKKDNDDVMGTWYSASGDGHYVVFSAVGTVSIDGSDLAVGAYSYDPGEMEGTILLAGRLYKFYVFLDDTLDIGDKVYAREWDLEAVSCVRNKSETRAYPV
jgi:hypothetical protein